MSELLSAEVSEDLAGNRLDQIAANLFPRYSRARLQSLIKEGKLLVNGQESRAKDRLKLGDIIAVTIEPQTTVEYEAEQIPLNILLALLRTTELPIFFVAVNPTFYSLIYPIFMPFIISTWFNKKL